MENKYDNLCELVKQIGLKKTPLGEGVYGKVFDFKIENDDTEYVLKVIPDHNQISDFNSCKQKEFRYKGSDGVIYIYKDCYKCNKESPYIEYFISLLASNTGSDYFLKANSIGMCEKNKTYILMEKADGILWDISVSDEDFISIILQIMNAIYIMHELKIQHNDLHVGNIFLKENKDVGKIETIKVGEDYFDIPIGKYIAKIGDWGLSNSFGDIKILNDNIGAREFSVPDYFSPSYDIAMFIGYIYLVYIHNKKDTTNNILVPFVKKIMEWIFGDKNPVIKKAKNGYYREALGLGYFNMDIRRCNQEFSHVTASEFFKLDKINTYKKEEEDFSLEFSSDEELEDFEEEEYEEEEYEEEEEEKNSCSTFSKSDKDAILAEISKNGLALKCAPPELRNDKNTVLAAVKQDGKALEFASDELKNDKEVVLAAINKNGWALQFASRNLRQDKELVDKAIDRNWFTAIHVDYEKIFS